MGTTGIQLKHLKYSLPMLQQCIFTTSPVLGRFAVLCCIPWVYPHKESLDNRNIMGKKDKQPKNT